MIKYNITFWIKVTVFKQNGNNLKWKVRILKKRFKMSIQNDYIII
jgi:hypothetical protein